MSNPAPGPTAGATHPSPFPKTLWTLVQEAARGAEDKSLQALGQLCVLYREPIRLWLERTGGKPDEIEDLTQGFIEHLLVGNRLKHVEPRATRFRTYLIECLRRFARGEWRKQQAEKRGGGAIPADVEQVQVGTHVEMDRLLDLDFARAIHQQSLLRLEAGLYAPEPKRRRLTELRRYIWGNDEAVPYSEVGQRLNMTPNHVKKAVFDLRQRYYESFREIVLHTVKPEWVDDETRYLLTLLAEGGGSG